MLPAFQTTLRTRGYECDATRTVPVPILLSYLEHLRWEVMLDPRLGVLDAVHAGHFFVVVEQTLEVVRRVGLGQDLVALAVLERVGRSVGWVRHALVRERDGAVVAVARVQGAWMGPNRRLARIPDRMREVCALQAAALASLPAPDTVDDVVPSAFADSFFAPPEVTHAPLGLEVVLPEVVSGPIAHSRVVEPSDTDIFLHVNAATYLRYVDDARQHLGIAGALRRVTLKHHREAVAGDRLDVAISGGGSTLDAAVMRGEVTLCTARVDLV